MNPKRILIYLLGMIILALGLTLNSKLTLGVSPILSLPFALSQILSVKYADLVFVWYCLFIAAQLILHFFVLHEKEKGVYVSDVLQIVISLLFTRLMDVFSSLIPVFASECKGPFNSLAFRLLMLAVAIILTGIGASFTLNMDLIPNPGDGIVAVSAKVLKKPVGTAKNIIDISCVILTIIISLLCKGEILGVGIGTLCAMLGVGRVINFINKKSSHKEPSIQETE